MGKHSDTFSLQRLGLAGDILLASMVSLCVFIAAITTDSAEHIHQLVEGLEQWELDELILTLTIFCIALSILNLKRWRTERNKVEQLQNQKNKMESLLRLSKALEEAHDYQSLIESITHEIQATVGYRQSWIYLRFSPDKGYLLAVDETSDVGQLILEECPTLTITGDKMLEEIFTSRQPVIVEDARTDPRTDKKIVGALGNRTIINIPILLLDNMMGCIGTGTFDTEGVRTPDREEIKYLQAVASHVALALDRLRINTLRQKAEAQLRLLSEAIEQTCDSIIITDSSGQIEYVNQAFTDIFGYSGVEATGKNPSILKSGTQDDAFYRQLWETISRGDVWQGEMINRHKDGHLCPILMTISPMRNDQGKVSHFIAIQSDLTAYRQLQEQFFQAQKMEALGTMLSGVSHDFNNTLMIIMSKAQLARLPNYDPSRTSGLLKEIENLSGNASEMIKRLMRFARKGKMAKQQEDASDLINQTVSLIAMTLHKEIQLSVDIEDAVMPIHADAILLQQSIINLLNNASDALIGQDQPRINISLKRLEMDDTFYQRYPETLYQPYLRLIIADNGCGISKENQQMIFEAFFTTKETGKGTGLGLSMVYETVLSHHGMIEVDSDVGAGTAFHIMLPIKSSTSTS